MLNKTNLQSLLKDKELLKELAYIGGKWVQSHSNKKFKVFNPSTGDLIASVPDMGAGDTKKAIEKAHDAFQSWSKKTAKERATILHKFFLIFSLNQVFVYEYRDKVGKNHRCRFFD